MADDSGRISVSRDALRAELATLELRLVERLATKAEVDDLARRVSLIELQGSPTAQELEVGQTLLRKDVDGLRTWRSYLTGAVAAVSVIASSALAVAIAYLF